MILRIIDHRSPQLGFALPEDAFTHNVDAYMEVAIEAFSFVHGASQFQKNSGSRCAYVGNPPAGAQEQP